MSAPQAQRSPRTRHPRPSRLALRCALGGLLASVILISCSSGRSGSSATPTSSPIVQFSPAWTAVLKQIGPNGEVSLATALQAYALAFGPLPGVQAPASSIGLLPSATLAVRMILRHYLQLTSAQQQAILRRLGLTAPASAQRSPSAVAPVSAMMQAGRGGPMLGAPAAVAMVPTPVPTDAAGTSSYRAMVTSLSAKLNGFLSYTLSLPVVLAYDPATPFEAYADGVDAKGSFIGAPVYCRISLNPKVDAFLPDRQLYVIAHELTHCYQFAIQGQDTVSYASPSWLIEASASWAGAVASGATDTIPELQGSWAAWLELEHPDRPLFSRAYSAIGFYALLDQAGISPWKVLPAMLLSQTKDIVLDNVAAYQAGTQSAPQQVPDEWASSYERDPSLGLAWDLAGPAILPVHTYGQIADQLATIANGDVVSVSTAAYTASDYALTSQADVLQVSISGTARLHDSASFERVPSADGAYCTKQGGCTCPQGSVYQGPALTPLTGLIHLALTGGPSGAAGSVSGLTLQQFCNKQKPKSAPTLSVAFCQQILSVAEANQFMQPSVAATAIRIDTGPGGGSCQYEYKPFLSVVTVTFLTYTGATDKQSEQARLAMAASEITNTVPGASVSTTSVTDIPDAALFIAAHATVDNITIHQDALDVIYGRVFISCANFQAGSAADAAQLSALNQVCKQVVTRLDP